MFLLAVQIGGFWITSANQHAVIETRNQTRDARVAQQALSDAQASIERYEFSRSAAALEEHGLALQGVLQSRDTFLIIERHQQARRDLPLRASILPLVDEAVREWRSKLKASVVRQGSAPAPANTEGAQQERLRMIRGAVGAYLADQNARSSELEAAIAGGRNWVLVLQLLGGLSATLALIFALRASDVEARRREAAVSEALTAQNHTQALFEMADLLQSAHGYTDANAVLEATAGRLLPGFGGTLYVFNNSRDRLDKAAVWNHAEPQALPDAVAPQTCWAIKRGKWQLNSRNAGALHCEHYTGSRAVLEMPMMARGELYGLLSFSYVGADARDQLLAVRPIAAALADAMSLALANIALREKLKNQALRDQLTGLYNRRYMEDMLDRLARLSERTHRPLSAIMIDLDHFKRLNDEYGHAAGDMALRLAAEALVSGLRETDVACRYGGEELVVLLPDCSLEDARIKAEELRVRIANSSRDGISVTASLGVSSMPETSGSATSLLAMADAALYEAKRQGRNLVAVSQPFPTSHSEQVAMAAE
ncbi:MAG TPA: GGDEF domain-containing protein [Allosphingosinicella sp.]